MTRNRLTERTERFAWLVLFALLLSLGFVHSRRDPCPSCQPHFCRGQQTHGLDLAAVGTPADFAAVGAAWHAPFVIRVHVGDHDSRSTVGHLGLPASQSHVGILDVAPKTSPPFPVQA